MRSLADALPVWTGSNATGAILVRLAAFPGGLIRVAVGHV